jgi:hypothetical protein
MAISSPEAQLELTLLNAKAQDYDRHDAFTAFANVGLPMEIIFRLEELWEATKVLGGKIIRIGKIIVLEIVKFIQENPNLATGIAIGAAVGALVSLVPFLGPLLAPLSAAVGALLGGLAGSRLDRTQKPEHGFVGVAQDVIILARKFFELLASIFMALKEKLKDEEKA